MITTLTLRALSGANQGLDFIFCAPANRVLGRAPNCGLRLVGDATVSRRHCLIEVEGESAWVQDLGSRNGTYLNGAKIGQGARAGQPDVTLVSPLRQPLHHGDELRVCDHVFVVILSDRPLAPGKERREATTRGNRGRGAAGGDADAPRPPR
jgi:pSer/pThr/pTyr-binding forkhead associated (FHA) protein